MNLRRFEHELYWGRKLYNLQQLHRADGFRGAARGTGFGAVLRDMKIPQRKAYRLIRRFKQVLTIIDTIIVKDEKPGQKIGRQKVNETICKYFPPGLSTSGQITGGPVNTTLVGVFN